MDERLNNYDWECAFEYAGERGEWPNYNSEGSLVKTVRFCNPVDESSFTREDVAEIIAISDGENDGENWIGVFRLKDGRIASLDAGCDYTGWDCQASGVAEVCGTLEEMIRLGLSDTQRKRLNLPLEEKSNEHS